MQIHMKTHKKDKSKKKKKLLLKKPKEEKKQEKVQNEIVTDNNKAQMNNPQIMINPVNNVNVWNCYIPYYPMNYQIINNINNVYYSGAAQSNIQEKGVK